MHRRRTRSDALPQLQRRAARGGRKRLRKARGWLDDDDTYNGEQLKHRAVADGTEDSEGSETQLPGRPDTEQDSGDGYERNGQSTEEDSDTVRAREQRDDEHCDSDTREQRHDQHDDSDDQHPRCMDGKRTFECGSKMLCSPVVVFVRDIPHVTLDHCIFRMYPLRDAPLSRRRCAPTDS